MDKILGNAQLKLSTDVEKLKRVELEKRTKVEDKIAEQRKKDCISQIMANKRRAEDDIERKGRLEEV